MIHSDQVDQVNSNMSHNGMGEDIAVEAEGGNIGLETGDRGANESLNPIMPCYFRGLISRPQFMSECKDSKGYIEDFLKQALMITKTDDNPDAQMQIEVDVDLIDTESKNAVIDNQTIKEVSFEEVLKEDDDCTNENIYDPTVPRTSSTPFAVLTSTCHNGNASSSSFSSFDPNNKEVHSSSNFVRNRSVGHKEDDIRHSNMLMDLINDEVRRLLTEEKINIPLLFDTDDAVRRLKKNGENFVDAFNEYISEHMSSNSSTAVIANVANSGDAVISSSVIANFSSSSSFSSSAAAAAANNTNAGVSSSSTSTVSQFQIRSHLTSMDPINEYLQNDEILFGCFWFILGHRYVF